MNTTLRTRLLLAISGTIIAALCVTQYSQYVMIRRQLFSEFDKNLGAKARALAVLVEQHQDVVDVGFDRHPMQEFARGIRPEYYQVWHENGSVLARSRRLKDIDLEPSYGDMVAPAVKEIVLPDGRVGRAAGIRFSPHMEGESLATVPYIDLMHDDDDKEDTDELDFSLRLHVTLVVAQDTQDLEASLARVIWLLVGSGTIGSAAILGVLAWLVTRHLYPLQVLARQIGDVNEQSLSQRFELHNAPGELQPVITRLNALMGRLESAFLREKTFTADVAHELRTPLAGIRSTLEVALRRNRDADSYRTSMKRCLQISEETETIISTLLSLSKIEAGQATLENEVVELSSFLRMAWRPFEKRASENGVHVDWMLDERLLPETDESRLKVVVSNLFDNAASYVDSGGDIMISTCCTDLRLEICVSNSGCQLSTEQVERVFDRFWRADSARAATGSHCGLGLALTQRIVQFLNGTIESHVIDGRFIAVVGLPLSSVSFNEPNGEFDAEVVDFVEPQAVTADA